MRGLLLGFLCISVAFSYYLAIDAVVGTGMSAIQQGVQILLGIAATVIPTCLLVGVEIAVYGSKAGKITLHQEGGEL
jgi:hypothetical protein